MIRIESPLLAAAINPLGAELSILRDADGRDLLHDGDPAFWASRAPLLFPIVGGLRGDSYRLDGTSYSMLRHGVARRQTFEVAEQASDRVRFRLTDNEETRAAYPFAFRFDADYEIEGAALTMTLTATNISETDMPVSLGYHPAFAWPLPYGEDRAAHRIRFDEEEPDTLALLGDGLIVSEAAIADRLERYAEPRHLDQAGRALCLHRALGGHCRPRGFRRRDLGQARDATPRAGRVAVTLDADHFAA
jgi:galactose mutarotase-like enzyme